MEEFVEIVAVLGDVIITFGAAYIAWLFWRTYKRSREGRSIALSVIFGIMAVYFGVLTIAEEILKIETFEWMESHFALEMMLMTMIIALSIVLSVKASWKGTQLKGERSEDKKVA